MMEQWLEHRSTYLNVLLDNEGRSTSQACSLCSGDVAYIRCSDCIGGNTFCIPCCLQYHQRSPFHRLLQWNGKHYSPTTLYALGFILCLGHDGNPCPKTVEVFISLCFSIIRVLIESRVHRRRTQQQLQKYMTITPLIPLGKYRSWLILFLLRRSSRTLSLISWTIPLIPDILKLGGRA